MEKTLEIFYILKNLNLKACLPNRCNIWKEPQNIVINLQFHIVLRFLLLN